MENKKKVLMAVMNTLATDARVGRAAAALEKDYDLVLVGTGADSGAHRYRQAVLELHGRNGILRYLDYIRQVKALLQGERFDLFYGHDYYSAALIPWVKKKFPGIRVIYDAHELMLPEPEKKNSRRDLFFYHYEKKALPYADLIVCASEKRSAVMREHYGLKEEPLAVNNISELPLREDEYSRELLEKLRPITDSGKTVLVYAGVLSAERKIGRLIDIAAGNEDACLLVIGSGGDAENLKKAAEEKIPGRYCFTGSVPYRYLGALLSVCDVAYISYPTDSLNNRFCAPNKIYEYASVGLPMIAPYNPTVGEFFEKYGIGIMSGNLEEAFRIVAEKKEIYRENCKKFNQRNPWSAEAEKLRLAVQKLWKQK